MWRLAQPTKSGLVTLTFNLLTLKVVSESLVTWATSVPILGFPGLSVLDLGPIRGGRGHNNVESITFLIFHVARNSKHLKNMAVGVVLILKINWTHF